MGAEKGHQFLSDCLELFDKSQKKDTKPLVGPDISTIMLRNYGLKKYRNQEIMGVKVYEFEYFYPYHFTETFNKDFIKGNTHCIHHWQISWKKKGGVKDWFIRAHYRLSRFMSIIKHFLIKS